MAWWLIDTVGTRDPASSGGLSSRPSGAWSSITAGDKFPSFTDMDDGNANHPALNDVVVIKSDINETVSADTYVDIDNTLLFISSDPTDFDTYKKCTDFFWESIVANTHASLRGYRTDYWNRLKGLRFKSLGIFNNASTGNRFIYTHCDFEVEKSTDIALQIQGDGAVHVFRDCNIKHTGDYATGLIEIDSGCKAYVIGGKLERTFATTGSPLIHVTGLYGGSNFWGAGVDLSDANVTEMFYMHPATASQSVAELFRCNLPATGAAVDDLDSSGSYLRYIQCDNLYQDDQEMYSGTIDAVNDVYHQDAVALIDGTTKVSMNYVSNANCMQSRSLRYGEYIGNLWFDAYNDDASTNDTLRIFFVCASGDTLDTADIVVEAIYPDSTTPENAKFACHDLHGPFETGAALSTQATSTFWTDTGSNGLATNAYYFDLALTSPGDGPVHWNFAIKKASVDVWVSPFAVFV